MPEAGPSTANTVPSRYRHVALSTDVSSLDPAELVAHFTGREAYYRTRYIVVRHEGGTALVEVDRDDADGLFSRTSGARVRATAEECVYVVDDQVDVGIPSSLAQVAQGYPGVRCIVVEGRYSHVSFILDPEPLVVHVLDVVPPFPSKLVDQVQRVLAVAEDLPPMVVVEELVDSRAVLAADRPETPEHVLVPCRGSGVEIDGAVVAFLDERPPPEDWVLLGCERSQQIHRWFYGERADLVDICPRRFLASRDPQATTVTRCCLIQEGIEARGGALQVPWGASLQEVRDALGALADRALAAGRFSWDPT